MRKSYITAITAAGVTSAYFVLQQGSPENAHPVTLTRDFLEPSLKTSDEACRVSKLETGVDQLTCAGALFDTTVRFYAHWRNAMAQHLYNSVYGTVVGDSSIGFHAAELDLACGDTAAVTRQQDTKEQLETVSNYMTDCINMIETGMTRLNGDKGMEIENQIQPADFGRLRSSQNNLINSIR